MSRRAENELRVELAKLADGKQLEQMEELLGQALDQAYYEGQLSDGPLITEED